MNHKFIPAVAAFLIIGMLLSAIPLSYAQTYALGPKLDVVTIPQDNQMLSTGVMILGIDPTQPNAYAAALPTDLMSQHKIIVTYNGATLMWPVTTAGPSVLCNVLEKDKVNVTPDPKTGKGQQGSYENLMTRLVDVSSKFICKVRWKHPGNDPSMLESVGVLDVYWVGPLPHIQNALGAGGVTGKTVGYWLADNILVVEAFFSAGRTVVFGSDIQDICTLGWGVGTTVPNINNGPTFVITKPDGTHHNIWSNAMGGFLSCESLALAQRDVLGIPLATGQDPLAP